MCRGLWAIKKKNGGKFPVHAKKVAAPAAASKKQASKFYPAGGRALPAVWLLGTLLQAVSGSACCRRHLPVHLVGGGASIEGRKEYAKTVAASLSSSRSSSSKREEQQQAGAAAASRRSSNTRGEQ